MDGLYCFNFFIVLFIEIFCSFTEGNYGQKYVKLQKSLPVDSQRVYEFVQPILYQNGERRKTTLQKKRHIEKATLVFDAFKKHFVIDLHLNRHLFTKSYIVKTFDENDNPIIRKPTNHISEHCYYHGNIRGIPHSIVSLSSCQGIRGHITDHEQSYYIEPTEDGLHHKLFIDPDTRHNVFTSDDETSKHSIYLNNATFNALYRKEFLHRSKRSTHAPAESNKNSRYVELYIVNDFSVYSQHRRDTRRIEQRSQEIANYVSKLYQPLNIFIALVGVEIWTIRDRIIISTFANSTLDNFLSYRRQSINPRHPNDNAQLITGVLFKDSIVGKAIKMSICTFQYSAGVAMDATSTTQVATTVAHELGHNFGMEHDNYSVCLCPEPNKKSKCIMATTGGGYKTPTKWSSCSQTVLNDNFEMGLDYCLRNVPQQLFEGPYCGNGFVEEGEECDCGLPENCASRCCNASSCKLLSGARCATGRCCDLSTCQPKSAASLCRPSPGECDLPEFCDGENEYCPADVFIMNGVACQGGQSYCYNGKCKTATGQCKLLWGSTGRVSDPICFKMLNINGSKYGNCGYNWTSRRYDRCDKDDVDCGLLHCVHLNEKLMFWSEQLSHATPATFLTKGRKKYVCRSAIMDVGLDMPDPGQVPDGSKCGDQKICVNRKCIAMSQVATPACPDCHGNGVCNTLGQCHCNEGFAPPNCDEPGHGGSEHSGPVKIQEVNSIMIGLLVFFLVVCPIVIIIIAVIFRKQLSYYWNKRVIVLLYRVPKFTRKSKGPKKGYTDEATGGSGEKKRFRNGGGVDISGPLLSGNSHEMTPPKNKSVSETSKITKVLTPPSKPRPPPKVRSAALLLDPEPDLHRKLPSAPDLIKHDPIIKKDSFNKHDPIVKKDSFNKFDPIVKKDSFNKEISKPVLISTTDRRSKAFVRESSNEKLKDANKNNLPPPVPPHAALKPSHSDPPIRPPPRPLSMPPKSDKAKDEKKNVRKSVVEGEQKSPERPPPPPSNLKPTAQKDAISAAKITFDPNNRRKEKDKPSSSVTSKTESAAAVIKFKPEKKTSTNAVKSSIDQKKTDTAAEGTKPRVALKLPAELKRKVNKPTPTVRDNKRQSTSSSSSGQEKEDSQPSFAAMKAMFDQKGSPRLDQKGSPRLDQKGSPSVGRAAANVNRPSPKPGSKVRSVNV